ncbi:MAG: nucleotide sugar dehydrogenase [Candidatus Korarchaeota archaeon NZ13-K]|nr:MAG: nucleotide sugar dehydrogenase [Candidatus Korarchaeota archaeon NZ13-K]
MNERPSDLRERVLSRSAKISVIGQGYIGLPIALILADSGFRVVGYDIDPRVIGELSSGKTRLEGEREIKRLLLKHLGSRYFPTNDQRKLMGSDVIIIAVPTPRRDGSADLSMLMQALRTALSSINRGGLIVIESTLPPKTFETLILKEVVELGFRPGEDLFISYCPERAMPGNLIEELIRSCRVIGAIDEGSAEISRLLYESFVEGGIEVTDPLTAEISKLVENAYRDVNIAFANEVARVCESLGVDVRRVREIVNRHPRVRMLVPGIGVGGSCLTKDPLFLYWASVEEGYSPELINTARSLNERMPYRYAELVDEFLRSKRPEGRGKVCVLGVTYKGDVPDTRESPAGYLIRELVRRGHEVRVHDPLVRESFGATFFDELEEAVRGADVVIIASDHSIFKEVNLKKLRSLAGEDPVLLLDGRLILDAQKAEDSGFIYASVGNITSLRCVKGPAIQKILRL